MSFRERLFFLPTAGMAALLHNVVHETTHYLAARLFGERVLEFRFLTNGWGTSQVVYATPTAERTGIHWLVIAWGPVMVTVLLGYAIYLNRQRLLTRWLPVNAGLWYAGLFFLCLDPLYFSVLSLVFGGDVNAVAAVDWPSWPVRIMALWILAFNAWLMVRWRREAQAHPEWYLPA